MVMKKSFNLLLLLLLLAYRTANAQATTELHTNDYGYSSNFKTSMAMVIVVFFCAFFVMAFFSICIHRCSDTESARNGALATPGASLPIGLDPEVVETFPILVYSAVKDLKIGEGALECAVCLCEFDDYETLRLIPKCDHVFHPDCVDAWLAAHVTCPLCRAKLAPEPNHDVGNSNLDSSSAVEVNEVRNDAVGVNEDGNQSGGPPEAVEIENRTRWGISGKFPRSHSTGHSLVRPGGDKERYTLRMPEEVRRQLVSSGNGKLRRSTSYNVIFPRFGSSRKGYRFGGGEGKSGGDNQSGWFDPWVLLRTPSSFIRGDGKTPLRSVKMPLDYLSVKAERSKQSISRLPV